MFIRLLAVFVITFFINFNLASFALEQISKNNIIVHYDKKNEKLAKHILEISENAGESVSLKTGIKYDKPLTIKISQSKNDFNSELGIKNLDIQGVAISDLGYVILNPDNIFKSSSDDIFKLLEHEFSHIFLGDYISHSSDLSFPRWLNEGIAQYVSGGMSELYSFSYQNSLQSAFIANKVLPFSLLINTFPGTRDNFTLAYAQSISMTQYLVDKYGEENLRVLINNIKKEENFYKAFSNTYSTEFNQIEREWLDEKRQSNYTIDYYFSTHIDAIINGLLVLSALLAFTVNFIRTRKRKRAMETLESLEN